MPVCCKCCNLTDIYAINRKGNLSRFCQECYDTVVQIARDNSRGGRKRVGWNYASRDAILNRMGFMTYKQYLESDMWRSIRARVYDAKGRNCLTCGNPATEVHHRRYHESDLRGLYLTYLMPICRACHEKVEFNGDKKCTVKQAKARYKGLCKAAWKKQKSNP